MSKAKKKAAKPAKKSTALAVRKPSRAPQVVISGLPPQSPVGQLGELATVGALGLAELKLTDAEESVLSESVDPALIQFKPAKKDGPAVIPYLPHIVYSRWLNRAFGRTGWAIVPTAAPKKADNLVLVPYLLYIHGIPVAAAMGEQEFIENNRQQTYGDVIESTVASALRRCCKRLGIGLEMWDKAWLAANASKGISVKGRPQVERDGFIDAEPVSSAAVSSKLESSPVLTRAQWDSLGRIAEKMSRPQAEVNLWLKKTYGVSDLKKIQQKHFNAIKSALEARGSLPLPGDGAE